MSTQYSPTVVQASEETHTFAPGRVLTRHDTSQLNLNSYCFVTFFDFLSLKNNVNVPSKSNKQKKT